MIDKELFPNNSDNLEAKDLKKLILQYARYWYLFLLGAGIGVGLAYLYLKYYAVPQYGVYSTMLIKDDKSGQTMSSSDALSDLSTFKASRKIDNEMELLKSKSLMRRVVSELDLSISYHVQEEFRTREIYGKYLPINLLSNGLLPASVGKSLVVTIKSDNTFELKDHKGEVSSHQFGQQIKKPFGTFTIVAASAKSFEGKQVIVRFEDIDQVANYYNRTVVIESANKEASVLKIALVDPLPEKAKNIINMLTRLYNAEAIEDKNLAASNTLKFLDDRLQFITAELTSVEKGVEKYKSVNGVTDITTQATDYTERAGDYNKQLSEWAIQIDVLESIEDYLQKPGTQYSMVPSTLGIKDETLLALIGKFNELQLERERMLRTTFPSNPLVLNLNEQLANLRLNILENLRNIKRGLQITSNKLKSNFSQFQSKIRRVPAMERELLEINRQQAIKHAIYEYLLKKREETALTLAASSAAARVIDPAVDKVDQISPNNRVIYLMAVLLGLCLPFAGIYIGSLLNDKVQTQQDVTNVVGAPIIGEIGHLTKSEDKIVVTKGNRSPVAEMYRLVRANLHFAALGKENLMLLMTSGMSGEGKTFFSINLASSLAVTGKRVVLIDLDLRNPKLAKELEITGGRGVTNYLSDSKLMIGDILRTSEKVPDLMVITSGPIPPNPAELMMSAKLAHLLHELKEAFDYVIIDAPPVGQVADAFTLGPIIDFSIYMVRYNYTRKGQLEILRNIYRNKTLSTPLVVLNDAKEKNGANYGYGYGYGYDLKEKKKQKASG